MLNGDLWIGDVGQNNWEEIDYEPVDSGGRNYGWRCYEGTAVYSSTPADTCHGVTDPILVYPHSAGRCSVTGGVRYRGNRFADMYGYYFYNDYCTGDFYSILKTDTGFINANAGNLGGGGYVSTDQDMFGEVYVCGLSAGIVYKLESNNCQSRVSVDTMGSFLLDGIRSFDICTIDTLYGGFIPGVTFQWLRNGVPIAGATQAKFPVSNALTTDGYYQLQVHNNSCVSTSDSIHLIQCLAIDEVGSADISIYPNPASDKVVVDMHTFSGMRNVKILDAAGAVHLSKALNGQKHLEIDVHALASGFYFLEMETEKGTRLSKSFTIYR
jgi:hypothetical protein